MLRVNLSLLCIREQTYEIDLSAYLLASVFPEHDSPLMLMTCVFGLSSRLARICMMKELMWG